MPRIPTVTHPIARRSNDEWTAVLRASGDATASAALDELAAYLRGTLVRVLGSQRRVTDDDLADFTQETLLRLVENVGTFRGDSAFTTWAAAVATRVAFTELRRRGVRERRYASYEQVEAAPGPPSTAAPRPRDLGSVRDICKRKQTRTARRDQSATIST